MSNILLLEDDLSLINGLSFAFKKQGFELVVAELSKKQIVCGRMENTICWCLMYPCQMAPDLNFAKKCGKFPKFPSFF